MGIKLPQLPAKLKSGISLAQIRQNLTIQDHTRTYRNIENNDCPLFIKVSQSVSKNAGHNRAIVGEPYNAEAHAKIPAHFMFMLCKRLCCVCFVNVQSALPENIVFSVCVRMGNGQCRI